MPSPQSLVEYFKRSEEFTDCTFDVMKGEVTAYLQVLVNEIQGIYHKFHLRDVKSLKDLIESGYTNEAPPAAVSEEKVAPEAEKKTVGPEEPMP